MTEPDDIEWKEVEYTERSLGWTEYELETGEVVRIRTMAAKIEVGYEANSDEKILLEDGEPLVRIKSSNYVEVSKVD